MPQLELIDICKVYNVGDQTIRAVDRAFLKIEKGDFVSIVGHSGSGKTTLLSIMGGIIRPTAGKMLYEGADISGLDDDLLSSYRNVKIGFMFQFASLLPILTAKENVLLPGLFGRGVSPADSEKAEKNLCAVGLEDKIGSYPSELSGGQQRRVAIARALMNDPEVILADEPTGDLDEETEGEIMTLFKKINEEKKVTFIFITHNLNLARRAGRQIRMGNGALQEA